MNKNFSKPEAKMDKNTYNSAKERYALTEKLGLALFTQIERPIQDARQNELSFASNETVNVEDFNKLLEKVYELVDMVDAMQVKVMSEMKEE